MQKNREVDAYLEAKSEHREILEKLRALIGKYPFEETIKWGMPTYVYKNRNLIGLGAFKHHAGIWFFQGALLRDDNRILRNAQEGKTRAMRQIHFRSASEIDEETLSAYLAETLSNEDEGLYVKMDRKPGKIEMPPELLTVLEANEELQDKFLSLTPGRQKEYAEHIASAKREETKTKRLEKILPMILQGKGLNDKYK